MSDVYYPPIDSSIKPHLQMIRQLLGEDPTYLDRSPYDTETRVFLKRTLAPSVSGEELSENVLEALDELKDPEAEVETLLREMKTFGEDILKAEDTGDRVAYFRVKTALIEKLITLKERASGVNQFSQLLQFLIRYAEDNMSPIERTQFMDALKKFGTSE